MSTQVFPKRTVEVVRRINPDVQSNWGEDPAIKAAPSLRQMSRDLRAMSKALQAKNLDVMNRATEIAVQYYDLTFGSPPPPSDLD